MGPTSNVSRVQKCISGYKSYADEKPSTFAGAVSLSIYTLYRLFHKIFSLVRTNI